MFGLCMMLTPVDPKENGYQKFSPLVFDIGVGSHMT